MILTSVKWLCLLVLTLLTFVLTPIIMFLVLPFLRQSQDNVLPKWLAFLNTYDDTGATQGMSEPQVAKIYDNVSFLGGYLAKYLMTFPSCTWFLTIQLPWYVKTWYWLGIRNQCYTLFNWLAPTVTYTNPSYVIWPWRITTTTEGYFMVLHKTMDIGFGWKLFNVPGKCSFYFRPRFWKKQDH